MSRSNRTKKSPPDNILSAAYLEGASGKKDELLRRLTNATELLSSLPDDDDTHHQHTHPNLLSFASTLVSPTILHHRDPDVRLGAILAILELFYIYAPNPPWSNRDVILIFRAIVRQLENLQHCDGTSSGTGDGGVEKFEKYFRILEQLSEVKIGVVLVDMIRTERDKGVKKTKGHATTKGTRSDEEENGDDEEDEDDDIGEYDALETLCELLRTLLSCVRVDHPPEVAHHAEMAVLACIEEFEGGVVPIQVLEELLVCVGKGPVIWVANPAYAGGSGGRGGGKKTSKKELQTKKKKKKEGEDDASSMPPPQIQQTNASYLVAARVLRRAEDKVSSPIAALLNGLLAGDSKIMGMSSLSASPSEDGVAALFSQGGKKKRGVGATTNKKGENDDDDYEEGQESSSSSSSSPLAAMDDFLDRGSTSNSSGTNVYSISYELHRIAPQILTTVIGTISSSLVDVDVGKRFRAAKLLGRLFAARGSDIASRFVPCFREWLRRSYDPEPKIRETMVKCLTNFLSIQHAETDLCADVNEALSTIIIRDPNVDIRLAGIHQVCNLAHTATTTAEDVVVATAGSQRGGRSTSTPHPLSVISTGLLKAVGNRVSSKNKTEHKDAITGLAQIYHKHYIRNKLRYVQEGGDDASTDEILEVWKELKASRKGSSGETSEEEEKLGWIPQRVFECVSFPDNVDPEMRNRIFQIVDDVLLGTAKKDSGSTLSATSRAVGLAIIVNFVKEKENAYRWMCALFTQRSCLQKAMGVYLDARSKARDYESGSPEAFAADAEALERLEVVASLSAPLSETGNKSQSGSASASELESILKKFHAAKDKHIFRILSTIASPVHSPSARLRAFDELPKRTKGLGIAAQSWVKMLARRCAMGAFLNAECIEHCIMLSQECFEAGDCEVSALFLDCIKMATSIFPSLGSTKNGFQNLVEFFDVCRTSSMTTSMKREMEKYGVVTMLSEILARCGTGPHPASSDKTRDQAERNDFDFDKDTKSSYDTLHEQLLRLCTRDGTPEQAKNSVYTISSMIKPKSDVGGSIAAYARKEMKEFDPLLKALVNPSRLYIPDDSTNPKSKRRIVSILSAIAAIAECAPYAFNKSGEGHGLGWGARSIEFALDRVLLGKSASLNSSVDGDNISESDDESLPPANGRRASKNAKGGGSNSTKSSEISVHCEMLCGAIEVLVSHIRSTVVHCRRKSSDSAEPMIKVPSPEHITKVFTTLTKIIEDGGIPPSSVNGRYCKTIKDQAFLRRCAAVNLLRLCDANLQLEATYLTPRMWHILSSALLDKDSSVRASVMEELAAMYTGRGKFRALNSAPMAPSLRFVSLVTLCADGDGQSVKNAATSVIKQLRTTCQSVQAQCRQQGRNAEKNFENRLKMLLMPEYSVPYALHLLVFRKETALAAGTLAETMDSDDEGDAMAEMIHTQEASQKTLKKRLKWLFDPLIQSLGSGADNISFLMRMIELIGKHPPVNVLKTNTSEMTSLETSLYVDEDDMDIDGNNVNEEEAMARMRIICQFAREVLLSHVKKDVNLTLYPGSIQFPGGLYSRPRPSTSPVNAEADDESDESTPKKAKKPKKSISYYVRKNQSQSQDETAATKSDNSFEDENLEDDDQSIEKDELEVGDKSEEDEDEPNVDFTGDTYDSVKKNALEVEEKSEEDEDEPNVDFTGDTYDHSASFSPSPSPHPHESDEFDKNLGDMSPIAKTNSPTVDVVSKGRKKSRSSAPGKKSTSTERKRKLNEINIFDEFPTPALSDGAAEEGNVLSASPTKKRKSTPKSGSSKKSKATPVSVPTSVLINVTNSTTSSARSGSELAGTSSRARKTSKKTIVATRSIEEEDDDFNFSDSPVKAKAKTTAHSRKKAALTVSSGTNTRVVASKAKAPAKAKATKAKVFRGTQSSSSPSTTTEASSRVSSIYRGGKRGARSSRA